MGTLLINMVRATPGRRSGILYIGITLTAMPAATHRVTLTFHRRADVPRQPEQAELAGARPKDDVRLGQGGPLLLARPRRWC